MVLVRCNSLIFSILKLLQLCSFVFLLTCSIFLAFRFRWKTKLKVAVIVSESAFKVSKWKEKWVLGQLFRFQRDTSVRFSFYYFFSNHLSIFNLSLCPWSCKKSSNCRSMLLIRAIFGDLISVTFTTIVYHQSWDCEC